MTTTPTEQEMAAAREINSNYTKWVFDNAMLDDPLLGDDYVEYVDSNIATIIHKHNEDLRETFEILKGNQEAALNTFHAEQQQRRKAEQQRDQLAARCAELDRKAKALDEVFAKCQVVFFTSDGRYIEHSPFAHKDNREAIESATRKEK